MAKKSKRKQYGQTYEDWADRRLDQLKSVLRPILIEMREECDESVVIMIATDAAASVVAGRRRDD